VLKVALVCVALCSAAFAQTTPPVSVTVTADDVNAANAAAVTAVMDAITKQGVYIQQQLADQQAQLANLQARAAVEDAPPVVSNLAVSYNGEWQADADLDDEQAHPGHHQHRLGAECVDRSS
jgi:hypothetical protein